jgi:hypothetical protein
VHPWGPQGVPFLGLILYAWWQRIKDTVAEQYEIAASHASYLAEARAAVAA